MRILLITDNHTPTGGAEKTFFELKARLQAIPTNTVFSLGFGPQAMQTNDALILKQNRTKPAKLLWQCLFHLPTYLKIKHILKTFKPDVIHLHNMKQYTPTVLRAIKGYPVVHTTHDFSLICPTAQNIHRDLTPCKTGYTRECAQAHQVKFKRPLYWVMLGLFLKRRQLARATIHAYLAPSPLLTHYLMNAGFTPAYPVLPFLPPTQPASPSIHPEAFLFAGNLGDHKGCTLLLQAFARAHATQPTLMLYVAGQGPLENSLKTFVTQSHLEKNVIFLGWQTNITPWVQHCAAVIFPSIGLESFGLVMTDAMSQARPLIASRRGTCEWLIDDGKTGLLFDPLTPDDLAQKILYLASHPEEAIAMGQAGQVKLDQMIDNETALTQTMAVYREVMLKHPPQANQTPEAAV
ncbi:MAG TPA: glycosyltransferase family 4 protein [Gammaproteobacteria bacterium]|nr:glycosyltransferase family 4 protein [Gammaproteobacteria bacterium]